MSRYPEFEPGSTDCRKCGFRDFHYVEYGAEKMGRTDGTVVVVDEWLERTCKTCRYTWREAVVTPEGDA